MRVETAVGKVLETSQSMSAPQSKREKYRNPNPTFLDALIP